MPNAPLTPVNLIKLSGWGQEMKVNERSDWHQQHHQWTVWHSLHSVSDRLQKWFIKSEVFKFCINLMTIYRIAKKLFSNKFPEHSPHLPLAKQWHSPTPNSYYWFRQCYIVKKNIFWSLCSVSLQYRSLTPPSSKFDYNQITLQIHFPDFSIILDTITIMYVQVFVFSNKFTLT